VAAVAFVLEEVGEDESAVGLDDVREQLAAEARLLVGSSVGEVEEDRAERVEVDAVGVPACVEVGGFRPWR
jgi:hypothetical protein